MLSNNSLRMNLNKFKTNSIHQHAALNAVFLCWHKQNENKLFIIAWFNLEINKCGGHETQPVESVCNQIVLIKTPDYLVAVCVQLLIINLYLLTLSGGKEPRSYHHLIQIMSALWSVSRISIAFGLNCMKIAFELKISKEKVTVEIRTILAVTDYNLPQFCLSFLINEQNWIIYIWCEYKITGWEFFWICLFAQLTFKCHSQWNHRARFNKPPNIYHSYRFVANDIWYLLFDEIRLKTERNTQKWWSAVVRQMKRNMVLAFKNVVIQVWIYRSNKKIIMGAVNCLFIAVNPINSFANDAQGQRWIRSKCSLFCDMRPDTSADWTLYSYYF